jgi:hypothetical protein
MATTKNDGDKKHGDQLEPLTDRTGGRPSRGRRAINDDPAPPVDVDADTDQANEDDEALSHDVEDRAM